MQTRKGSVLEIAVNYISGFGIAWFITPYVLHLHGFPQAGPKQAFTITIIMTVVSVVRSYICRRVFNKIVMRRINNGS